LLIIVSMDKNTPNDTDNSSKKLKSWHPQQEKILKNWSEVGSSYRYLHDKSFNKYERCNMCFSLPVIILSTLTGVANFAQSSFPVDARPTVSVVVGSLNIIAGLITTIAQFLKVAEKMEGHRAASVAYSKFSRNISVELSLPVKERLVDGTEFLSVQRGEMDRLIEQSPNIPEDIVKLFDKTFIKRDKKGNKLNDENAFYKPEILDIRPVEIYKKTSKEIEEEEEQKRVADMKRNKELQDIILKDETKRRNEIYKDVMNQIKEAKSMNETSVPADTSEPQSIEVEMQNIMQELNMNEINDMGFDIEANAFVSNKQETVDITNTIKNTNNTVDSVNTDAMPVSQPVVEPEQKSEEPVVDTDIITAATANVSVPPPPTETVEPTEAAENESVDNEQNDTTIEIDLSDNDLSGNTILEKINIE
jgi:hypothetical protein